MKNLQYWRIIVIGEHCHFTSSFPPASSQRKTGWLNGGERGRVEWTNSHIQGNFSEESPRKRFRKRSYRSSDRGPQTTRPSQCVSVQESRETVPGRQPALRIREPATPSEATGTHVPASDAADRYTGVSNMLEANRLNCRRTRGRLSRSGCRW